MDVEVARLEAIKLVLQHRGTKLAQTMGGGNYPYSVSRELIELLDEAKRVAEFISEG